MTPSATLDPSAIIGLWARKNGFDNFINQVLNSTLNYPTNHKSENSFQSTSLIDKTCQVFDVVHAFLKENEFKFTRGDRANLESVIENIKMIKIYCGDTETSEQKNYRKSAKKIIQAILHNLSDETQFISNWDGDNLKKWKLL